MGITLNDLNLTTVSIGTNDGLLGFGDGVFETMLADNSTIINWSYHWQRLSNAAKRLGYQLGNENDLRTALDSYLQTFAANNPSPYFVIKLIVGRGEVNRGFKAVANTHCHYFVKCVPYTFNRDLYQGVDVIHCQQRLGLNPLLAGFKRVSAMDYVLIRQEVEQAQTVDGLIYAIDDNLIECSSGNIFLVKNRQLITPDLTQCGVAGTLRAQLLANKAVKVTSVTKTTLSEADSLFITNAVIGVIPIRSINGVAIACDLSKIYQTVTGINHPCLEFYA